MAKVKTAPGAQNPVTTISGSKPGRFYRTSWKGVPVIATWPRKRPRISNPTTLDQMADMKKLTRAQGDVAAEEIVGAMAFARGSGFAYRDVLARAMLGRWINFNIEDLMTESERLDTITNVPGSMLFRNTTEWVGLAPPSADKVLKFLIASGEPEWEDETGGGGGLWSGLVPGSPITMVGTGMTTLVNIGTATAADNALGFGVLIPASAATGQLVGIAGAAPSAPYELTALVSAVVTGGGNNSFAFGWYDGTNKLQVLEGRASNAVVIGLDVQNWNSPTSYAGSAFGEVASSLPALFWLKLADDGTNISFSVSADGGLYLPLYSVAKAAGFLGSSGYSNFFIGYQPQSGAAAIGAIAWNV